MSGKTLSVNYHAEFLSPSLLDLEEPPLGDTLLPPPPTAKEVAVYTPPRSRYGHLTDPYFQRGLVRVLDRQGGDFNETVKDISTKVIWSRTALCPNRTPDPGSDPAHMANCKICGGRGFIYWATSEVDVAITSLNWERNYQVNGIWEEGLMRVVFPSGKIPRASDKITLLDEARLFDEVKHRVRSGLKEVYKLQFTPLRVEKAFVTIPRGEWPLPSVPEGPSDQEFVLLPVGNDQIKLLGGREVLVECDLPRSAAITFVYFCQPEFLIEKVENFSREFYRNVPNDQLQQWTLEQIESPEQGWPIATVAKLLWQEDSHSRGDDDTDHYGANDGLSLRSSLGTILPPKLGCD